MARLWRALRNIWYNNSRYQVPLITLNPQPGHTPCSLNFRVILIFRQLPSAYSIVSALLHPRLRPAFAPLSFVPFSSRLLLAPWPWHTNALAYKRAFSRLRIAEGVDDHVEYGRYINGDLRLPYTCRIAGRWPSHCSLINNILLKN